MGIAALGLLALVGIGLGLVLARGSVAPGYRQRVGALCTAAYGQYTTQISHLRGATGTSAGYSRDVFAGQLFEVLVGDSAEFDRKLAAIAPPQALRVTEQRYLALDRADDALYGPLIPLLEHGRGTHELTNIQGHAATHERELQSLLSRLGGPDCSENLPGLG